MSIRRMIGVSASIRAAPRKVVEEVRSRSPDHREGEERGARVGKNRKLL